MRRNVLVKIIGIITLFLFLVVAVLSLTKAIPGIWFWAAVAVSAFIGYYLLPKLKKE